MLKHPLCCDIWSCQEQECFHRECVSCYKKLDPTRYYVSSFI